MGCHKNESPVGSRKTLFLLVLRLRLGHLQEQLLRRSARFSGRGCHVLAVGGEAAEGVVRPSPRQLFGRRSPVKDSVLSSLQVHQPDLTPIGFLLGLLVFAGPSDDIGNDGAIPWGERQGGGDLPVSVFE